MEHSYPHSWRSRAPVIFRNTPQWFVNIDKDLKDGKDEFGKTIRERALHSIDKLVEWVQKVVGIGFIAWYRQDQIGFYLDREHGVSH